MVTKLLCRGYEARLYQDAVLRNIYHYTVSQAGDVHILAWGQEHGREAAERAAEECIQDLAAAAPKAA